MSLMHRMSMSMADGRSDVQLQLLSFHESLLQLFPSSIWPQDYATSLLNYALTKLSPLLRSQNSSNTRQGPKRGRKRGRGQEDVLIGALAGKEHHKLSPEAADLVLSALRSKHALDDILLKEQSRLSCTRHPPSNLHCWLCPSDYILQLI